MLTVLNSSHDPFYNQAFEEYVFEHFREGEIFLLWQNDPAVIVAVIRTSAGRFTWSVCGSWGSR